MSREKWEQYWMGYKLIIRDVYYFMFADDAPTRFPYLLPNILGASLALAGLPLVLFFLEETLDVHKGRHRYW